MNRKASFLSVALAAVLAAVSLAAEARAPSKKTDSGAVQPEGGPRIEATDEELEKEAQGGEEGLKRLGNFGRFHLFGYGELHYNGKIGPTGNEIDFHRLVLGVGYDFADWLIFRSELDFEHAFKEPELEFAYLDFLIKPWASVRLGAILVPMGVLNEHHEPPLFYSVERPELYRVIIPTSWQGAGAGVHGKFGAGFDYELYGLSSLTAVNLDDTGAIDQSFSGSEGFHDDHSIGEAPGRDFGAAGRLQYKGVPGLRLGTSFFVGNTGQGNGAIGGGLLTMLEADAKYSFQGIDLDGAFAFTNLSDSGNINNVLIAADPTFSDFVGRQMLGFYVEGAYHLLHHLLPETKHDVVVFGRFEDFDTQFRMPTGFAKDPANDRNTVTAGISYLPIPQVAIKADYMFNWNRANAGVDQFNLGVGFYY
ncbi:MAG TPA: hypothetical protein VLJ37_01365 [bacterium]|nr:hypothetical protein [bacterium]